jgi:hypothetical protein
MLANLERRQAGETVTLTLSRGAQVRKAPAVLAQTD